MSDIRLVVSAIASSLAVHQLSSGMFGAYAIGLAVGFFGYLIVALVLEGFEGTGPWFQDLFSSDF